MLIWKSGLCGVMFSVALYAAFAQQPANPPPIGPQGSEDRVRVSSFQYNDEKTGAPAVLFESVPPANNIGGNRPSRIYLSPLNQLVPLDKGETYCKIEPAGNGKDLRVTLHILYYTSDSMEGAANRINALNRLSGENAYSPNQISKLAIARLEHELVGFPQANLVVEGLVGGTERVQVANSRLLQFILPKEQQAQLQAQVAAPAGLEVRSKYYFNAIGLRKRIVDIKLENFQKSNAFRQLDTGGGSFVSVNQVQDVLKEAGTDAQVFQYQDPGVDQEINARAEGFFNDLLNMSKEVIVDDIRKAQEADQLVRQATKITAQEFKPIELSFKYSQDISRETNFKNANRNLIKFKKEIEESTKFGGEIGGRLGGFFSLKADGGKSRITKEGEIKEFENQGEFEDFKKTHLTENGNGVRFVSRGVGLVEKGTFLSKIKLSAFQVQVTPVNEAGVASYVCSTQDAKKVFGKMLELESENKRSIEALTIRHDKEIRALNDRLGMVIHKDFGTNNGLPRPLLNLLDDGRVQITTNYKKGEHLNFTPGDKGSGLYLADQQGKPIYDVSWAWNKKPE